MPTYLSYLQTNTGLAMPCRLSHNGRRYEQPGLRDGSPEGSLELEVVHYFLTHYVCNSKLISARAWPQV